jgi:hypothetical protein
LIGSEPKTNSAMTADGTAMCNQEQEPAMKSTSRAILRSSLIVFLVAAAFGPATAQSATVTAFFMGTVTGAEPNNSLPPPVKVNDAITISASVFTYNSSVPGKVSGNTEIYSMPGSTPLALGFQVICPGFANFGDSYKAGGPYSIEMSKSGSNTTMTLTAETSFESGGVFATTIISFTSSTYTGGLALPSSTAQIDAFVGVPGTLVWDPGGFSLIGTIEIPPGFAFGSESVPEPSSFALALIAIATGSAGGLIYRRKAKPGL